MALFISSTNSQHENYAKLSKDIVSIRDQMQVIKNIVIVNESKKKITSEQKEIKSNIRGLTDFMQIVDKKIVSLESNMDRISKSVTQSAAQDNFNYDDILMEVKSKILGRRMY